MRAKWYYDTPVGVITVAEEEGKLVQLLFGRQEQVDGILKETNILKNTYQQLEEYFVGTRHTFTIPLGLSGTHFQTVVWQALQEIPYGATWSYQQLASKIGCAFATRAVGMANHKNPISILIPCHRVIGKNKKLTGYGGGLAIKKALLELEGIKIHDFKCQ